MSEDWHCKGYIDFDGSEMEFGSDVIRDEKVDDVVFAKNAMVSNFSLHLVNNPSQIVDTLDGGVTVVCVGPSGRIEEVFDFQEIWKAAKK